MAWIDLDGSVGEGGGQIVRTACTLSAVTGKPFRLRNVRAKRSKPGLQAQHVVAVQAAARVCSAHLTGAEVGSTEIAFEPSTAPLAGHYRFDIGTAGSAPLVLQTVLPILARGEGRSRVEVRGGTHNPMAPTVDYLEHVFGALAEAIGFSFRMQVAKFGWFPKGGGEVFAEVDAGRWSGFQVGERLGPTRAIVSLSQLPGSVAERAQTSLRHSGIHDVVTVERPALQPGFAVCLVGSGRWGGFVGLGERGKPVERVIEDAVSRWRDWQIGDGVDEHLGDQLVPLAAMASGPSSWRVHRVDDHLRTVLWLVPQFVPLAVRLDEGTGDVHVAPA